MLKRVEKKSLTHEQRQGKNAGWGENGAPRPTTDKYRDGWDKVFGKPE